MIPGIDDKRRRGAARVAVRTQFPARSKAPIGAEGWCALWVRLRTARDLRRPNVENGVVSTMTTSARPSRWSDSGGVHGVIMRPRSRRLVRKDRALATPGADNRLL